MGVVLQGAERRAGGRGDQQEEGAGCRGTEWDYGCWDLDIMVSRCGIGGGEC